MFPLSPAPMEIAHHAKIEARAEQRVRMASDVTLEETELEPASRYDVVWRGGQSHFVALYKPRFVVSQVLEPEGTAKILNQMPHWLLHVGAVGLEHVQARYQIKLYSSAAYGVVTTTGLLRSELWDGNDPPPDPLPLIPVVNANGLGAANAGRFRIVFSQTRLIVPIRLTPRVALTPEIEYFANGGADVASRGTLPLVFGPSARITFESAITPTDRLRTSVVGTRLESEGADRRQQPTILRAEFNQAWRHSFSNYVAAEVSGGGSVAGDNLMGVSLFSLGAIGLFYDSYPDLRLPPGAPAQEKPPSSANRFQAAAMVKTEPWFNIFSAELEPRAVSSFAARYTTGRVLMHSQVSISKVVPTPRTVDGFGYSLMQIDSGVHYGLSPQWTVQSGVRFGVQDFANAIRSNSMVQATVFAALQWAPIRDLF